MTAATTSPARGQVSTNLVSLHGEIFNPNSGFLAAYNVEREEEIELLGISLISGLDPLFLGDPGTGKTWMIELLMRTLKGATPEDFFDTLVFKETPAQDILGPLSPAAMKAGRIERMLDGFLPRAVVGYIDEVFKCSPTLANSLLDLYANRVLKVGPQRIDCRQLLCIFSSSNELPDREDMQPFRDRIGLTKFVAPVRSPENRKRVMQIQDAHQANARQVDMSQAPELALDDVRTMRAEVQGIEVPDPVFETLVRAQERWSEHGFAPSQRRVGQMLMAIKARAWSQGRDHCVTDDLVVTQHMAWNHPDHAKAAHDVVMEFANVFQRKAARMSEALEPILSELGELKKSINESGGATEEHLEGGFKIMRKLRTMRREANDQIEQGRNQGQDVRDLEKVLDEVNQAHAWVEKAVNEE